MNINHNGFHSQNDILLHKLLQFYENEDHMNNMLSIINGSSKISLRIVDWFSTNYSKKYFTMYSTEKNARFKVYEDYKLKLKAYSKKRFDPFCRWERIQVPIDKNREYSFETTIGQLNFFKWAIENDVIEYIMNHYEEIEKDMNSNNTLSKTKKRINNKDKETKDNTNITTANYYSNNAKTRKKREELSLSAVKTFKNENVEVIVTFD